MSGKISEFQTRRYLILRRQILDALQPRVKSFYGGAGEVLDEASKTTRGARVLPESISGAVARVGIAKAEQREPAVADNAAGSFSLLEDGPPSPRPSPTGEGEGQAPQTEPDATHSAAGSFLDGASKNTRGARVLPAPCAWCAGYVVKHDESTGICPECLARVRREFSSDTLGPKLFYEKT